MPCLSLACMAAVWLSLSQVAAHAVTKGPPRSTDTAVDDLPPPSTLPPPDAQASTSIHTVITTECTRYFTWQTIGIVFSHRKAGQPGPITRLMSCTPEEYAQLPDVDKALLDEVPTHFAPSYSVHPKTGDVYPGINKPVAVLDWLAQGNVTEDYILILDADMILRRPILPHELGAGPGWAVAGYYGYMKGVSNELALRHVPEVQPRNDTLGGPPGRRGDQVSGFSLMRREDLQRVAPLWLKYSEDVRWDPEAWRLTGDEFVKKGERPWIAEMYGYAFGCARADVWHRVHKTAMHYPGYSVTSDHCDSPPKILHYGILWHVQGSNYSFDKHHAWGFDAMACPPWDLSLDPQQPQRGLLPHPPRPSSFNTTGASLMRDLLAIEVVATLNEAFCERHRKHCPPSEQLDRECSKAESIARELEQALARLEPSLVGQSDSSSTAEGSEEAEEEEVQGQHAFGVGSEDCQGTSCLWPAAENEAEEEEGGAEGWDSLELVRQDVEGLSMQLSQANVAIEGLEGRMALLEAELLALQQQLARATGITRQSQSEGDAGGSSIDDKDGSLHTEL